jgi:hypothetical protein
VRCWSGMLGRPELRPLTVAHCRSETPSRNTVKFGDDR